MEYFNFKNQLLLQSNFLEVKSILLVYKSGIALSMCDSNNLAAEKKV